MTRRAGVCARSRCLSAGSVAHRRRSITALVLSLAILWVSSKNNESFGFSLQHPQRTVGWLSSSSLSLGGLGSQRQRHAHGRREADSWGPFLRHARQFHRALESTPTPTTTDDSRAVRSDAIPMQEEHGDTSLLELGAWVPVGSISSLKGLIPVSIEMMGRHFVVWNAPMPCEKRRKNARPRKETVPPDRWSVLLDECPHRQAPLSQGRIDPQSTCLECPYHGWQFEHTNGTLTRIPHLPSEAPLLAEKRSATSFDTHVTGDILWTFLPTEMHGESFPRTLLPEQMYSGLQDIVNRKGTTFYTHDMPCSFDFFVENTLDAPSHAHFAHHGLSFSREQAEPLPCKVMESNFTHLSTQVEYTRNGVLRRRRFDFQRPFYATNKMPAPHNTEEKEDQWVTQIIFLKTPIRDGWCRMISNFALLPPWIPDWIRHVFNLRFLEGDSIQHLVEYNLRASPTSTTTLPYIHATSADTPVRAWRQWWLQFGMATRAPPHTFGPAQPRHLHRLERHQRVDPWRLHTSHCHKCRAVLRRCKFVRNVSWVLFFWACAAIQRRSRAAVLLALVGGCTHAIATRLIWELEGPPTRDRVGDRTPSAAAP